LRGRPEQGAPDPGSGGTRLGDLDRDRINEALAQHAAAGRLTVAQLEERVDAVFRASTREEAARTLADLPPLEPGKLKRWGSRGHAEAGEPGPGWTPTAERFRDPRSGRIMRVWIDPVSGERHYVAEPEL
jgi:Domain of unknown function (DUF1707)